MKVIASEIQLASEHQLKRTQSVETEYSLSFSQILSESAAAEDSAAASRQRLTQMLEQLLESILAAIEGRKCRTAESDCRQAPNQVSTQATEKPVAAGREVQFHWQTCERLEESESTNVHGCGKVKTADGRSIDFNFAVDMQREFKSSISNSGGGKIELHDPLVLNFSGAAAELNEQRIDFDLDADGKMEKIPGLTAASGYLVLDRNGNGRVDNGKELFGPNSGNGFSELAKLDQDGNGWLDEADPAYADLRVWRGGNGSDKLSTLKEQGVGAIWLGSVDSPFTRKDAAGKILGEIRATGVYLNENGLPGSVQQVDLALEAKAKVEH